MWSASVFGTLGGTALDAAFADGLQLDHSWVNRPACVPAVVVAGSPRAPAPMVWLRARRRSHRDLDSEPTEDQKAREAHASRAFLLLGARKPAEHDGADAAVPQSQRTSRRARGRRPCRRGEAAAAARGRRARAPRRARHFAGDRGRALGRSIAGRNRPAPVRPVRPG